MNACNETNQRRRRVRRSAEQWAQLIQAQTTSGLSIAAFCRQHDLPSSGFYHWRRRLEGSAVGRSAQRPFVRLRVSDDVGAPPHRSTEAGKSDRRAVVVRFIDGVELRVGGERLGELLSLLRESGSAGVLS